MGVLTINWLNANLNMPKPVLSFITINFDVTDEVAVDKGISTIEEEVAPVDILVNNAGINQAYPNP